MYAYMQMQTRLTTVSAFACMHTNHTPRTCYFFLPACCFMMMTRISSRHFYVVHDIHNPANRYLIILLQNVLPPKQKPSPFDKETRAVYDANKGLCDFFVSPFGRQAPLHIRFRVRVGVSLGFWLGQGWG